MLLKYLIDDCPIEYGQTEITSLELKASDVKKGSAFFALKGNKNDGNDYVSDAISRGAVCIISERPISVREVVCIRVDDERHALADISARFYGNPQKNMRFVGITGTNGKTTTSYMIKSILETAGCKTGIIGTLGAFVGDERVVETNMTTPDPPVLFFILSEMEKRGVTHVVMEVSAHALALKKTDGIVFDVACLTNFGRDHLDYFKTSDKYKAAKSLLFEPGKCKNRVISADDSFGRELIARYENDCRSYGINNPADAFAIDEQCSLGGIRFIMNLCDDVINVSCPIAGRFNVYNAVCASLACRALGVSNSFIAKGLKNFKDVKGRFNVFGGARQKVVIDFAHTEDSLKNAIKSLKECADGKLVVVFGCGGNRDRGKRPAMGAVAAENADFCVITSDNPRYEKAEDIIGDVVSGIKTDNYVAIPDRREAIRYAVECAGDNGVILIAGKGGEEYQEINGVKLDYSDEDFVKKLIDEKVIK